MAVEGLEAARAKMRALPVEVQAAVRSEMERIAEEMVIAMRAACPKDSGELATSIGWTWGQAPSGSLTVTTFGTDDFSLTIFAGSSATEVTNSRGARFQKAKLLEFGTKEMAAQPYFFPVIRAYKRSVTRRINAAGRKAAKAVWSR
jgi:HK97 gp10 family phage protein